MPEHQLYLNLGDNRWLVARCSCGQWHEERQLHLGQRASEVIRQLERDYERHAGIEETSPYTPALPTE